MTNTPKVERPKLAGAFSGGGVPDRAAGLSGLLPPPPTAAPTPAVQPEPSPALPATPAVPAGETLTPKPPRAAAAPVRSKPAQPTTTATDVANIGVYLEPDVLEAIRRAKRTDNLQKTYDELLVEAFEQVSENQLRAHFHPEQADGSSSLLPSRRRRPRGTAGIQVQVRLDGEQRDALATLAARVGAPSRSALVAAVYRLALLNN